MNSSKVNPSLDFCKLPPKDMSMDFPKLLILSNLEPTSSLDPQKLTKLPKSILVLYKMLITSNDNNPRSMCQKLLMLA